MYQCYDCGGVLHPVQVRGRELMPGCPQTRVQVCARCEARAMCHPPRTRASVRLAAHLFLITSGVVCLVFVVLGLLFGIVGYLTILSLGR